MMTPRGILISVVLCPEGPNLSRIRWHVTPIFGDGTPQAFGTRITGLLMPVSYRTVLVSVFTVAPAAMLGMNIFRSHVLSSVEAKLAAKSSSGDLAKIAKNSEASPKLLPQIILAIWRLNAVKPPMVINRPAR